MTINDRLRHLRKEVLKKTQQEFSAEINISRSNLGNIETGEVSVTDRLVVSICEKYKVREEWLRAGEGDIFKTLSREDDIAKMVADLFLEEEDSFKFRMIKALCNMDKEGWDLLEKLADNVLARK